MIDVTSLVVLLVFYTIILIVGVVAAKRFDLGAGQQSELSLVAGRRLGSLVGILTMTATVVGGGYVNGTAEFVATQGLIWTLTPFCIFLGLILGGLIYARKMRDECYVTMLDPFQKQYGNVVAFAVYLASVCGDVFWTASILTALGTSVSVIVNLDVTIAIVSSSSVTVLYTLIGQMVSVAYTDMVQLLFIVSGLTVSIPFILTNENTGDIRETSYKWLGELPESLTPVWVDLFVTMTLGTIPWQAYFQRVLSMKTARDAQIFSVVAAFGGLVLAVPSILIGAVAVTADWNKTSVGESPVYTGGTSNILPLVIHEFSPPAISVLGLSAICAAVMSSMDSSILGSSSMFTHNIFKSIIYPKCGDRLLLWVQRVTIIVIGAISTVVSLTSVDTIIGLFIMAADVVFICVLPNLTCALFVKSSNSYGAIMGYLVGILLRFGAGEYLLSIPSLIKYPFYIEEEDQQIFPFRTFAFLCSLLTIVLVSHITNRLCVVLPRRCDVFDVLQKQAQPENVVLRKYERGNIDLVDS